MSALTTWLTAIADAIRGKDGTALPIDHIDFPAKIAAIPQLDTSDATALVTDILAPKTAYVDGEKITGTSTYDADTSSGTAVEADIASGKIAWVDGAEVTGTSTKNADTTDATAVENSLLYGHTAYGADGTKLTGAGAYWQYAKSTGANVFEIFKGDTSLVNASLYWPGIYTIYSAFSGCSNIETINFESLAGGGALTYARYAFLNCAKLTTISGAPLNFTSLTGNMIGSIFLGCAALVTVGFAASSIYDAITFVHSPLLSTASLLSIANGIGAAITLTLHATSKTNCDNILVDNVGGVAVLGSAMTLSAFITGVKGATIA